MPGFDGRGSVEQGEEACLLLVAPIDIGRNSWKAAQLHPVLPEVEASLHIPHIVHIYLALVPHQVGGRLPRGEIIEVSEEVPAPWRRSAGGNAMLLSLLHLEYSWSSS